MAGAASWLQLQPCSEQLCCCADSTDETVWGGILQPRLMLLLVCALRLQACWHSSAAVGLHTADALQRTYAVLSTMLHPPHSYVCFRL
jgi:hypothetical protein